MVFSVRLQDAFYLGFLLCALACAAARAGSVTAASQRAGVVMDDAGVVLEAPEVSETSAEPRNDERQVLPAHIKVYPGHVAGKPPRPVRGGYCYLDLGKFTGRPPSSLFKLDAKTLKRIVNLDAGPGEGERPPWAHRMASIGSLLGAPPAIEPSTGKPAPPRMRSDISAFGASGPGATPFTIKHGVQVQSFFQHSDLDFGSPRDTFSVRRFVIYAIGELGRPETTWSYTLIAQGPVVFGTHAWVQEEFNHAFRVRFGEFKMPTARQQLAPTRELLTFDKSLATRVFAANALNPLGGDAIDPLDLSLSAPDHGGGDSIGIQFWGDSAPPEKKDIPQFRWFLAAFKGPETGGKGPLRSGILDATALVNDNTGLEYIGRIELQPLGYVSYSEGALDQPKHPLLAIDLTASIDKNQDRIDINGNGKIGADPGDSEDRINTVLGMSFKLSPFSVSGEYYRQLTHPYAANLRSISSHGWYYTLGFLLMPKHLELCYNDSLVVNDEGLPFQEMRERGPALTYYLTGHKQKLTLEHTRMTSEINPRLDRTELRFQYLYAF